MTGLGLLAGNWFGIGGDGYSTLMSWISKTGIGDSE